MKELTTDELFNLAWSEMDNMKKNTLAITILCIIVFIQGLFVLITLKGLGFLISVDIVSAFLYFYHNRKFKKSDKLVEEILEELNKRGI